MDLYFLIILINLENTCNPPLVIIHTCNESLIYSSASSFSKTVTISSLEVGEVKYMLVESLLLSAKLGM